MSTGWTTAEKKIAHRVFDAALRSELAEIMQAFKSMAAAAKEPNDLWSTEEFLTQARKSINQKYDYRYSQLEMLFVRLLRENRISKEDLTGLSEEKLHYIDRIATP